MKRILLSFMLVFAAIRIAAQPAATFGEILDKVADRSQEVWGVRFSPDLIVVYPSREQMYKYHRNGAQTSCDSVVWDREVPAANTAVDYRGKRYVVLVGDWLGGMNSAGLLRLTAHESFHYYQDSLHIPAVTSRNAHMDLPEGRALLRMEFEALHRALQGDSDALNEALHIRETRRQLYPDNNESRFELHEGLAEYTGIRISCSSREEVLKQISNALRYDKNKGYANSFAYISGPAYALLLDRSAPGWMARADKLAGLSEALTRPRKQPKRLITTDKRYLDYLKSERLSADDPAQYTGWLTDSAEVLRIPNDGIGIVFNPNDRVTPVGSEAVLLRNVTLRGEWGMLTIRRGLLRRNDWTEFIAAAPESTAENIISGVDYTLELTPGWTLARQGHGWVIANPQTEMQP